MSTDERDEQRQVEEDVSEDLELDDRGADAVRGGESPGWDLKHNVKV